MFFCFEQVLGFSCYSILGWSDGANIAAMMAAKYAGQVKKIVVWGGNCFVTPEELELYKSKIKASIMIRIYISFFSGR